MVVSNDALVPEETSVHGRGRLLTNTSEGQADLERFCELAKADPESLKNLPGAVPCRDETFGLSHRTRYAEWFAEKIKLVKDSELLLRVSARAMRRPMIKLRSAINDLEKLKSQLKERHLTSTGLSKRESMLPIWMRKTGRNVTGVAVRRKGAGRKSMLSFLYTHVREWFLQQRHLGFFVSRHDLLLRFVRTARTFDAKVKEVVSSGCILGAKERLRSEAVLKFLLNWGAPERSRSFEDYWQKILMKACDAVLRAPQRLCQLSRAEELNRWIWTLRNWDDILYLSMGSDKKWLAERVFVVDKWLENLKKTCVLMSGQIPFWVNYRRILPLKLKLWMLGQVW